jgi:hypothetical protein
VGNCTKGYQDEQYVEVVAKEEETEGLQPARLILASLESS